MLKKGAETRNKLIQASLKLFQDQGFHRVGLPEIGRKVGIAHASIYAYFRNKEELMEACAREVFEQGRQYVDAGYDEYDPADKKLLGLVRGNLAAAFDPKPVLVAQVLALHYFGRFNPALHKLLRTTTETTTDRIENQLKQGVREGLWRVADPRAAALAIHSLLLGEMFKALLGLQEEKPLACTARVCAMIRQLIGAKP
jgi:AcrR family transcriptional regulator